ncbi:hypothetical protein EES45_22820 [Streptomyces sp. ADI97-07]|uniref:hypothetical protein n=1 Tax=Streptomyces sp. ADI97-07 TaxID=1522762 RepID=UPI000FB28574|nr:hypothetical protein [Streptomyces sp. ADI97-07]RPK76595.1 hypothetical protein EES45_22820 [Streptomyces sp. ADI97-07]
MITLVRPAPDRYRRHLRHLYACTGCASGRDCPKGAQLRRAVAAARSQAREAAQ